MDNTNYTFRLNNYIKDICIDNSQDYSEELQNFINLHNTSISQLCQSILSGSILSILIKKGIITEEEFLKEFEEFFNSSGQKKVIENNRDQLLQCIEAEKEFNEGLKEIHDMHTRHTNEFHKPVFTEEPYDDLDSLYWDPEYNDEDDDEDIDIGELLNSIPLNPADDDE